MNQNKPPVLLARTLKRNMLRVFVVLALLGFLAPVYTYTREYTRVQTVEAATGINRQINFQGKLVNPNGTNVTDGSYSIVFSMYSVASAGSANWTETQSVTVTNGIFQVNLGSVSALPSSVDFNTDNIYLGIKVGADAEMSPRIRFTAVPQAFNAEKLGGLDKTGFIQNSTTLQSTSNFYIQSNNASNVTAKFRAISGQSADIIQVRDSGDTVTVFAVSPAGTITAGTWNGTALTDAYVSDTLTSSLFVGSGSTSNAIDLGTAEVAGTLGVGNGGTGLASYTAGDLLYASGTTTLAKLAAVAPGSCLTSQGVGVAPAWSGCVGSEADTLASVTSRGATTSTNVTFNGTLNATADTTFSLSGTENIAVNSDLDAGVNLIQVTGTPSSTAGTTRGLLIQQANSANTNGLDTGLYVNNADTDLPIGTAIQINNSGGGGFTNYISAPSFTLDGTGTITAGTWNGTALTDAYVSNTLTSSIFIGSGSTSNAIDLGTAEVAGTLGVGNGGTGATSFTNNGVLYGNNTGAIQATAAGTGGQILLADISGIPTFTTISGDVTISTTGGISKIEADAVALGADTTGNYVAGNTAGTGIAVTGSAGEGWSPAISLDYSSTLAGNPTLIANQSSFASTGLIFEGSTANTIETLLTAADPAGADVTLTLPNVTGTIIGTGNISDITGLIDSQISNTLTASILIGSGSTTNAVDLATAEVSGALGVGNGGTGITSYTIGDLLYASASGTLSKLAAVASGSCLISQGVGTAPVWGSCGLAAEADTLATVTARGATTSTNVTFNGTLGVTSDTTFTLSGTENIAINSDLDAGVNLIQLTGTPSATAGTTRGLFVQQANSANTNGLDTGIYVNNADTDLALTTAIQIANTGGGGYTNLISTPSFVLTGAGAISGATGLVSSGTVQFSGLTTNGFVKTNSGNGTLSVSSSVALNTSDVSGTLGVANGGTGAATFTAGSILFGNGTSSFTESGVLTNGQLLIGDGSGAPTAATLTQGSDVTITNGAGSITVAVNENPTFTTSVTTPILTSTGALAINSASNGDITINANGTGTLQVSDASTFASTLTVTGATTANGTLTANSTLNANANVNFTFNGTENLAISSDLDGSLNALQVIGTPSATAGTTRGVLVQQADSVNTNGLDTGVLVNNADTDLAIGTAIQISNSGGGGYTNYISAPGFVLNGTGTITTGTWQGSVLTDAYVSDSLTASDFLGSGSTTTAVDLGTAEVSGTLSVAKGGTGTTTLNDLIILGTHTQGNYVASNTAGTGIAVTGSASEGWSPTISLDYTATLAGNPTLPANQSSFASTGLIFEGSSADTNELLLISADPAADVTLTLPAVTGTIISTGNISAITGLTDSQISDTLTVDWTGLQNYPSACSAGQAIIALNDTPTCTAFLTSFTEADTLATVTGRGATTSSNVTFNGTLGVTSDTTFTFSGTENLVINSDLNAGVNVLQVIGTPSATAGATRGLLVQQANSANTNGLDQAVYINNADTDLAITSGIQFANSGGGGFTNYISAPSFTLDGTGTITAGTWNGTAIGGAYGGTGIASYTVGDLLYASGASTLSKLAAVASGSCLKSQGTGTAPAWGSCGLASEADTLATVTGRGATTSTNTTFNGTLTVNNGVTFGFTGTQKLSVTSDLNGSSNTVDIKVTPSSTAGTNRGLFIQQNDDGAAGGTNGLNAGVYINNAEADLVVTNAIQIASSGAAGYTNLINTPSFRVNGSGAISGATGISSSGTISLGGTAASSLTTSSGALTLTGAAASTWSTSAGTLTLQAATTLNLGTATTTGVSISRTGVATTVNGSLTVTQAATLSSSLAVTGAATFNGDLTVSNGSNIAYSRGTNIATTGTINDMCVGPGSFFKFTGAGAVTLTGMTGASGCGTHGAGGSGSTGATNGRMITFVNDTGSAMTVKANSSSSAAGNKIFTGTGGTDLVIRNGGTFQVIYDDNSSGWRTLGDGADTDCSNCASKDLSNLTTTSINRNLIPDGDDTRTLGTSGARWSNIWGTGLNVQANHPNGNPIVTFTNSNNDDGVNRDILQLDFSNQTCNGYTDAFHHYIVFQSGGTAMGGIQAISGANVDCTNGAHVLYDTDGGDYAEYFLTDVNNKPAAHELVSFKNGAQNNVTERATDPSLPIVGAVSTNAGFVGNSTNCPVDAIVECKTEYNKFNSLVALVGQVEVKVNNSNGAIKVGDPIGLSTTPGIGSKQIGSGYIVGYAMEKLDAASGEIMVVIRPGYFTAPMSDVLQGSSMTVTGDATINGSLSVGDDLNVSGATTLSSLTVTGNATVQGNLTVVGNVETKNIKVNGHIITAGGVPTVTAGSGAGVAAGAISAPLVEVIGNDTSGTITITAGANGLADVLANINFAQDFGNKPHVMLTAANRDTTKLGIYYDQATATNSNVKLMSDIAPEAGKTYVFSYFIVE